MHGDYKKVLLNHPDKLLSMVLVLVAIHTLAIGLTLIAQPAILMEFAGFNPHGEHFFPAQGGAFHLIMVVVYLMGATHIEKYHSFIVLSIFIKAFATFFLLIYCFAAEFKWIIFISGVVDCAMGLIIFLAFQHYLRFKKLTALSVKNE
jgi:hypothetical protein